MFEEYNKKRDFKKTNEPEPKTKKDKASENKAKIFVIQKHDASNLHWDLRLEDKGVLLSWAVPKGVPQKSGNKRLAIKTEDHPLEYADFEGKIPEGEYGAGQVKIEDRGEYKLLNKEKDLIEFRLKGKKYQGNYVLVRPKNFDKDNYLLFKKDGKS